MTIVADKAGMDKVTAGRCTDFFRDVKKPLSGGGLSVIYSAGTDGR
jgi:hypothetical protein